MTQRYVAGMPPPGTPAQAPTGHVQTTQASLAQESMVTKPEPPLKEVLIDLWENAEKLLRQEAALASAEIDSKIKRLKTEMVALAMGGAILYAGLLALVAGLILLLSLAVDAWLAAFIVAAVMLGVGFALVKSGPKPSVDGLLPERTIENVKKDVQALTEISK